MTKTCALFAVLFAAALTGSAQSTPGVGESRSAPATSSNNSNNVAILPYQPITSEERLKWFVVATVGPQSLGTGLLSAGLGTARNRPIEYGPHWEGFGRRYGMRLTGIVTSNAMEAGIGSLWGEDPRYYLVNDQPVGKRIKHVVVMTFAARRSDGHLAPAYARYIAKTGSNFLSGTWRPESSSQINDAISRTALGFASSIASNAFKEFLPDLKRLIFRNAR